jgi:hypothetical protein
MATPNSEAYIHKQIMLTNQRLNNIFKIFGDDSTLYLQAQREIINQFKDAGLEKYLNETKQGNLKIDIDAASDIASLSSNERAMFYGTFKNIKTVKEMKKETARKMEKSVRSVSLQDIEASIEFQKDFDAAIGEFYKLLEGDDYRKALLPMLYGNDGDLDQDVQELIMKRIDYYKEHATEISEASLDELREIRKEAAKEIRQKEKTIQDLKHFRGAKI